MIQNKKIAVVVPAYNEESQIGLVLDSMPAFVDRIIVVNDASTDRTADIIMDRIEAVRGVSQSIMRKPDRIKRTRYNEADMLQQATDIRESRYFAPSKIVNETPETDRIILINLQANSGKGAAIARGYKWCLDHQIDCTAIMDGDGQMDPAELESIVMPVVNGEVDYVKGNRLIHRSAWLVIPKIRYFGNSILSILTKIASGYWRVSDSQCGYTAISLKALQSIRIHHIYRRYGMPNDLLVKLNIAFCTVKEVEIKPVYRVGEQSKMKVWVVIPKIAWLLFRCFFKRLWIKYLFRDFHPLFLLYHFSLLLGLLMIPYIVKIINLAWHGTRLSYETLLIFIFLATSGFQSLLFAMWMDIQDNDRYYRS
jgi:glycosyltransferase involved in cell wall biosynthesis